MYTWLDTVKQHLKSQDIVFLMQQDKHVKHPRLMFYSGIVFWFSKGTRQSLFKYLLKGQKNTNRSSQHQMPFEMRIQNDNIVLRYIHMMLYRLHRFKEFCGNLLLTQESSSTFIPFLFSRFLFLQYLLISTNLASSSDSNNARDYTP